MLDENLKIQLREVFSKLSARVVLRVWTSDHADQAELLGILQDLATVSDQIQIERVPDVSPNPYLEVIGGTPHLGVQGKVAFRGVPGGHEFTSLVLAILHCNGRGKLPDAGVIERIRGIQGPIRLRTFVSLTCENCPEVVQALNLMAILHPDFHHETIDGAVAQSEVMELGIQGVPSVMHGTQLIHSGKIQLVDLIGKLEMTFGHASTATQQRKDLGQFDVVVIGGGPAGASAAIYSVRKGLKTAIIAERLGGQLQETKAIENMISVPYTEGTLLAAQLYQHLTQYPVTLLEFRRVREILDKQVELESGEHLRADTVIIATGAQWRRLGIPGEKEYIGQGVAFCAHCDGPFYKGKKVAVVGGGNSGVEAAIDLAGIAADVTLLEFNERLKADGVLVEKLAKLSNVKILTQAKSVRVIGDGKKVTGLEYQNQVNGEYKVLAVDGVFVQIGLLPNSSFVKGLVDLTPQGEIVVDPKGRTSVRGIYAAGDVTTVPFKQIVVAMGDGAKVALAAFEDRMHSRVGADLVSKSSQ